MCQPGFAFGFLTWLAIMPATPFSRSHHQKRLAMPAHHAVFLPRPVGPGSMVIMKDKPHLRSECQSLFWREEFVGLDSPLRRVVLLRYTIEQSSVSRILRQNDHHPSSGRDG